MEVKRMKKALVRAGLLCIGVITTAIDTPMSLAINDMLDAIVITDIACHAVSYKCLMTTKALVKEVIASFLI